MILDLIDQSIKLIQWIFFLIFSSNLIRTHIEFLRFNTFITLHKVHFEYHSMILDFNSGAIIIKIGRLGLDTLKNTSFAKNSGVIGTPEFMISEIYPNQNYESIEF